LCGGISGAGLVMELSLFLSSVFLWVYWELLCFVWLGNIGSWISYGIERLKGHKHGGILGAGLVMELSG
jgi:hypothetical protein